jgi:hypothetical protein
MFERGFHYASRLYFVFIAYAVTFIKAFLCNQKTIFIFRYTETSKGIHWKKIF